MKAGSQSRIARALASLLSEVHYGFLDPGLRVLFPSLALFVFLGNGALAADRDVHLTFKVVDEQGKPISGAKVNVHQSSLAAANWLVMPPDHSEVTNAEGLARVTIKGKEGEEVKLAFEVAREDLESQKRNHNLAANSPARPPPIEFTLKKKSAAGSGPIISVVIDVQSEGEPVEGASVLIRDSSLGAATGRFSGVTGADGRATIPVMYASADSTERLPAEASKSGYKTGKISINLAQKQVGKTVIGGTIKLEKASKDATKVTVTVTDSTNGHRVGDASVVLDGPGYYSQSTNSNGEVTFLVGEPGGYQVRISQDTYRDFTDGFRLVKGEKEKPLSYQMVPKAKKDEGHDRIEITVLKKDPTDEKSTPSPLSGASVKGGTISTATDANGKATLEGAFADRQEVSVQATGYKTQSKTIALSRFTPGSKGTASAKFTLDPDLSENSPIRIIVEVRDTAGTKISGANVDFYSASGALLGGGSTKNGVVDFRSSDSPSTPIAELRKGITVTVKKTPEYKVVLNRSVPSNLLAPSLEAGSYTVQLERDWSELEKALAALEGRVAALKNEATGAAGKAKSVDAIVAKFPAAKGRTESILAELKKTQQAFDPKVVGQRCQEAADLVKEIKASQSEAAKKEEGLKKMLDEAIGLAANCKSKTDSDVIKAKHRDAIKAAGEIGVLGKKAGEANRKLTTLAETMKDGRALEAQLQKTLEKIEGELDAARKESATAHSQFNDAYSIILGISGKRAALLEELTKLKTQFQVQKNEEALPPELKTRLTNLEQLIASLSSAPSANRLDEVMKPVLTDIEKYTNDARGIVSSFKRSICTVQAMDDAVQEISSRVTGATIELGAAAELPARADACAAKAVPTPSPRPSPTPTSSPTPTPSDEVTVPDISAAGNDPKAMKAAAGPDLVGVIMATKASPTPGSTKLFASQSPAPNTKAKRGSILKIFVYQSLAEATPTPSPTASASASPSATPSASPSATRSPAAGAGNMPDLFGKTLEQAVALLPANMRIKSDEVGDKPPTLEKALTIFAQTPAAGSTFDPKNPPVVTVKRYGSAQAEAKPKERFDGTYTGSYSGNDSGTVRFSVSGGTIAITSPGRGTGQISASGSASISGSGANGESSYTFSGTFTVGADGKATAAGRWTGKQYGYTGHGTWSASRR